VVNSRELALDVSRLLLQQDEAIPADRNFERPAAPPAGGA
jgi:hypothetical protein